MSSQASKRARPADGDVKTHIDQDDREEVEYGVPVKNAFDLLKQAPSLTTPSTSTKAKPPPIFIEQPPGVIMERLKSFAGKYTIKYTGKGAKIFTSSMDVHSELKTSLSNDKQERFHTFTPRDQRHKRFVLYGLAHYPIEEAKQYLADENIKPVELKYMFIKKPKYDGQCNYILYFAQTSNTTLAELNCVRAVNHTIIKWAHYKAKATSVRPCQKCQTFGHGSAECGRAPRCAVCAEAHLTPTCPLLKAKKDLNRERVEPAIIKCCNCEGNHTSTYPNCPVRLNYLQKSKTSSGRATQRPEQIFTPNPEAYPEISSKKNNTKNATPTISRQTTNSRPQWRPTPHKPDTNNINNNDDDKLYTAQECQQMLDSFYTNLQNCTSKLEQAKVIADFGIKYFCKF